MNKFIKAIHHFFNPHCHECELDNLKLDECKSCETLRFQLEQVNHQNRDLLNAIISKNLPPVIDLNESTEPVPEPVSRGTLTSRAWQIRKQTLEAEDRARAAALRNAAAQDKQARAEINEVKPVGTSSIEELEKELGIQEETING